MHKDNIRTCDKRQLINFFSNSSNIFLINTDIICINWFEVHWLGISSPLQPDYNIIGAAKELGCDLFGRDDA